MRKRAPITQASLIERKHAELHLGSCIEMLLTLTNCLYQPSTTQLHLPASVCHVRFDAVHAFQLPGFIELCATCCVVAFSETPADRLNITNNTVHFEKIGRAHV